MTPVSAERLAERLVVVRRWRESKRPLAEFARAINMRECTLRWWVRLAKGTGKLAGPRGPLPQRVCSNPDCRQTFTPRIHHGAYCSTYCRHHNNWLRKRARQAVVNVAA